MTRALFLVAALLLPTSVLAQKAAGSIFGRITVTQDGKPIGDSSQVVVYLAKFRKDSAPDRGPRKPVEIEQRYPSFLPPLTVVVKGTNISFPNPDKITHDVYLKVPGDKKVQVGSVMASDSLSQVPSYDFQKEGAAWVKCAIHPSMWARVLVVPNPYFVTTQADGSFTLKDVPPGDHKVIVWHLWGKQTELDVTVRPGEQTVVAASVERGERPKEVADTKDPFSAYKR